MNLSQHKLEERVCPGCNKSKSYPARQAACCASCALIVKTRHKVEKRTDPIELKRLQLEICDLKLQLKHSLEHNVLDEGYQKFIGRVESRSIVVPKWTIDKDKTKTHDVVPVVSWSDWHLDEVVKPNEVHFRNAYNREIALMRLKRFTGNTIKVAHDYLKGFTYRGLILASLGDIFSGGIHEELRRSNVDTVIGSMIYWIGPVVAMLNELADEFGSVHVPCVVGNHGRNSIKPIFKGRVRDNFDWLFMQMVARDFEQRKDERVTFEISDSMKLAFKVFDHGFIATHGDECRGGSGIAGMLSPQLIAYARMQKSFDFTYWILGHWHNLGAYRNIRVNGCGKGFDEYALGNNFDFTPPQQDFFLVNQRDGVIGGLPIFCTDKDEPWRKQTAA